MKKNKYVLQMNNRITRGKRFRYNYSNTKDLNLIISAQNAELCVYTTSTLSCEKILYGRQNMFTDAIKKACICQVIEYGKPMTISIVRIYKDDVLMGEESFDKASYLDFLVTSIDPIPKGWLLRENIEMLLGVPKSKQDCKIASLFAYITARGKNNVNEKFIYYWMAVNGIYNYISSLVENNTGMKKRMKEKDQLKLFSEYLGYRNEDIEEKDVSKIKHAVEHILLAYHHNNISIIEDCSLNESFITDVNNEIARLVKNDGNCYDVSAEAIVYLVLPYTLRCKLVHANKPVALVSNKNEPDFIILKEINGILDSLIYRTLPDFFSDRGLLQLSSIVRKTNTYSLRRHI